MQMEDKFKFLKATNEGIYHKPPKKQHLDPRVWRKAKDWPAGISTPWHPPLLYCSCSIQIQSQDPRLHYCDNDHTHYVALDCNGKLVNPARPGELIQVGSDGKEAIQTWWNKQGNQTTMETELWETRRTWGHDRGERGGNNTETGVPSTGDADDKAQTRLGEIKEQKGTCIKKTRTKN